jgi:hypothetical protein
MEVDGVEVDDNRKTQAAPEVPEMEKGSGTI